MADTDNATLFIEQSIAVLDHISGRNPLNQEYLSVLQPLVNHYSALSAEERQSMRDYFSGSTVPDSIQQYKERLDRGDASALQDFMNDFAFNRTFINLLGAKQAEAVNAESYEDNLKELLQDADVQRIMADFAFSIVPPVPLRHIANQGSAPQIAMENFQRICDRLTVEELITVETDVLAILQIIDTYPRFARSYDTPEGLTVLVDVLKKNNVITANISSPVTAAKLYPAYMQFMQTIDSALQQYPNQEEKLDEFLIWTGIVTVAEVKVHSNKDGIDQNWLLQRIAELSADQQKTLAANLRALHEYLSSSGTPAYRWKIESLFLRSAVLMKNLLEEEDFDFVETNVVYSRLQYANPPYKVYLANMITALQGEGSQLSNRYADYLQTLMLTVPTAPVVNTYTVAAGDTLGKIAQKYATTIEEIVRLNNIANPNLIFTGQNLIIRE
jgi:hypothetical protein